MDRYLIPSTSTLPRNPMVGAVDPILDRDPEPPRGSLTGSQVPSLWGSNPSPPSSFPVGQDPPLRCRAGRLSSSTPASPSKEPPWEKTGGVIHTRPRVWSQYTKNLDPLWKGKCQYADKHFKRRLISPLYNLKAKTKGSQTATWSLFSKCYFLIRKFTQQQINLKDGVNKTPFCGNL